METQPWLTEPNRYEFEYNGYACLINRDTERGFYCGYVAMPPGHPWHKKHYEDCPVEIHGGLSYADSCHGKICHVPKPGASDDIWWLGFDCGHGGDYEPNGNSYDDVLGVLFDLGNDHGTYRDLPYVTKECMSLVDQAILAEG